MKKFTKSVDGLERCTVRVELRLTREQYEAITKLSQASNLADSFASTLSEIIDSRIEEAAEAKRWSEWSE